MDYNAASEAQPCATILQVKLRRRTIVLECNGFVLVSYGLPRRNYAWRMTRSDLLRFEHGTMTLL